MINKFKDLSLKMKILIGIGVNFLVIMALLLSIIFYQSNNLSTESGELLEKELLKREKANIKSLVQTRAKMLAQFYTKYQDELKEEKLEELLAEVNHSANIDDNYFFIYQINGETVSLPPTPNLNNTNRWELDVQGRKLVQEMSKLAQQGGGSINYPYTNPKTGRIDTKYGYIKPIKGTDYFVGMGGYKTEFNSIVGKIKAHLYNNTKEIFYFLIFAFFLVMLIIFEIILMISNYINTHINKLLTGFQKVVKGRLDYKLEHKNEDEFQKLASGFNYMLERIKNLTYNDPITDLPNMKFLEGCLKSDLTDLTANDDQVLYLFTLGISNFSLINSNYGYELGNKLLEHIFLRLDEIIDEPTTIARKNNHFIFYFESDVAKNEVKALGSEIIEQLSTPYNLNGKLVYAELKLGIAVAKSGELNYNDLIKRSQSALHFTRSHGKEILFYSAKMQGDLSNRIYLESKLRQALDKEEFLLHYHPLVKSSNNKIIGVEALIRWNHPQEGMISPGEFIPVAEDTGLIVDIGTWVLEEACEQLREWHNKGYDDLVMSVNVAPKQFQKPDFVAQVAEVIQKCGIEAQYLKLEITERTVIENIDYTVKVLEGLKELGVRIAIDDFGTGYSSLEYLTEFALDALKIDRAFVHKQRNKAIVKTIITMGSNLGLSVIAEGVETEEELAFLRNHNCEYYQGYLFSRPAEAEEIEQLIER